MAGVTLGAYLQSEALSALADSWLPVLLICAATLGLCLIGGAILARTTALDPPTAALGMIAGGASGIVGMSGDLGADDRLVAFMQYLRVLIVVLLTPIGIAIFFGSGDGTGGSVPSGGMLGEPVDWVLTAAFAAVGALVATRARVTAGALLGPMVLTGIFVLSGAVGDFAVPDLVSQTAFALIGLQVGLRFTRSTVRLLGRLTGPVLLMIAGAADRLLRPRPAAQRSDLGVVARLLPGNDAGWALRGARRRLRRRCQHHLHRRRPEPAGVRDDPARPRRGAVDARALGSGQAGLSAAAAAARPVRTAPSM